MGAEIVKQAGSNPRREANTEVREIRKLGREIAASKQSAVRFLASTRMHDKNGRLKPRFS